MNAKRALRLRKEVLTELAGGELALVVGGDDTVTKFSACYTVCITCPVVSCIVEPPPHTSGCTG